MKRELSFLTPVVIIVLLLGSCIPAETQPLPTATITRTLEPSLVSTNTRSPTQTATTTPSTTSTSLPTIFSETAQNVLSQFVQTNGGCQLPCLFGLTPGVSGQAELHAFLSYFHFNNHPLDLHHNGIGIEANTEKNGGSVRLQFWHDEIAADIDLGYIMNNDIVSQAVFTSWSNQYFNDDAHSLYDDTNYKNILEYFSLKNILNTYGLPSQILIAPFPDDPGHPSPPAQYAFSTVLIYPEMGFLVQYVSIRGQNNEYYFTCPANSHIDVSTWDAKQDFPVSRVVNFFSGVDSINSGNVDYFKKIDEATSYTVETFYEKFKSLNSKTCIQTDKSLWQIP